jgi:P4 family phage/plasmid primase-like protien
MGDVLASIERFRVSKGSDFTHTALGPTRGCYYIANADLESFFDLYTDALDKGSHSLHLTEKHRHISPVCIDVDLRYPPGVAVSAPPHFYSERAVVDLLKLYAEELFRVLDFENDRQKTPAADNVIQFYLLEKPSARKDAGKKVWKDGFHVMAPHLVTRTSAQHVVRTRLLDRAHGAMFCDSDNPAPLNPIEDVLDEAVISKNNWFMYGSRKVDADPTEPEMTYALTRVICIGSNGDVEVREPPNDLSNRALVSLFSLRNKVLETPVRAEFVPQVQAIEEGIKRRHHQLKETRIDMRSMLSLDPLKGKDAFKARLKDEDMAKTVALVEILSPERAERYIDWIRVGWCLRNIDDRLLEAWIAFSQKSKDKFQEGACEHHWSRMQRGSLGIGTLHMWAKLDNPELYNGLRSMCISNLVSNCMSGTHHDISLVVYQMFQHRFVCSSIRNRQWWEYSNHRWRPSDSGYALRKMLSEIVSKEFVDTSADLIKRSMGLPNEGEQERQQDLGKKILEISRRLKNCSFKENIMKECADIFYKEKFEERLDSNLNIIGFENGVYDLDQDEFREGRPEDYLTFSTGNNYVPYDENSPVADSIQCYLSQVITKPDMREYLLKLLGSFLHGDNREQKFYIWTGSGANSKSMLVDLFENAFGDYCCKLPITLLTQKRAASNAATSEIAKAKGKRFAVLQEPSEDEKMNIGLMKELSGGDKIMARCIYKEPIEFKPQFKMILLCNHLPDIPSDDDGTWRRIRVLAFTSKFVSNPSNTSEGDTEFPIDYGLSAKMAGWKEMFMALIIRYYRKYFEEGLKEPDEVVECTNEYKKQNDHLAEFIQTRIVKDAAAFLTLKELFDSARTFMKECGIQKVLQRIVFEKYAVKKLGQFVMFNSVKGFRGYRLNMDVPEETKSLFANPGADA